MKTLTAATDVVHQPDGLSKPALLVLANPHAVIAHLGGLTKTAAMIGRTPPALHNALTRRGWDTFPADTYRALSIALSETGATASIDLWDWQPAAPLTGGAS
jgi:hypothetical protein